MSDSDLWGLPMGAFIGKRKSTIPKGHASQPGGGPKGETCKTCHHITRKKEGRTYLKCGLARSSWTHGTGSDIRAKDPACYHWKKKEVP